MSLSLVALTSNPPLASPNLQLDMTGGAHDATTQTIISPGSQFPPYACMANIPLNYTFYFSAAPVSPANIPNAGAFSFNSSYFNIRCNGCGANKTVNTKTHSSHLHVDCAEHGLRG